MAPMRDVAASLNINDRRQTLAAIRAIPVEKRPWLAAAFGETVKADRPIVRIGKAAVLGASGYAQSLAELTGAGGTADEIRFIQQLEAIDRQGLYPKNQPRMERYATQAAEMAFPAVAMAGAGGKAAGAAKAVGLGKAAVTAAEVAGVTAGSFPQEYRQAQSELQASGVDPKIAKPVAVTTALVSGAIESIVPNPFRTNPVLGQGMRRAVQSHLMGVLKRYPGELSEEFLQSLAHEAGTAAATYLDDNAPNASIDRASVGRSVQDMVDAAGPLALLMGAPAAAQLPTVTEQGKPAASPAPKTDTAPAIAPETPPEPAPEPPVVRDTSVAPDVMGPPASEQERIREAMGRIPSGALGTQYNAAKQAIANGAPKPVWFDAVDRLKQANVNRSWRDIHREVATGSRFVEAEADEASAEAQKQQEVEQAFQQRRFENAQAEAAQLASEGWKPVPAGERVPAAFETLEGEFGQYYRYGGLKRGPSNKQKPSPARHVESVPGPGTAATPTGRGQVSAPEGGMPEVPASGREEGAVAGAVADPWSNVPGWVRDNMQPLSGIAERSGVADKIEDLAAKRKTAKQIAAELNISQDMVNAVRIARGIPSWTLSAGFVGSGAENPEFTAWLRNRQTTDMSLAAEGEQAPRKRAWDDAPNALKQQFADATEEDLKAYAQTLGAKAADTKTVEDSQDFIANALGFGERAQAEAEKRTKRFEKREKPPEPETRQLTDRDRRLIGWASFAAQSTITPKYERAKNRDLEVRGNAGEIAALDALEEKYGSEVDAQDAARDSEADIPSQENAPEQESTGGKTGLKNLGGAAMAEGLYESVWERLQQGKHASPFATNPPAEQAAEDAYKRGEIASVDDVKRVMQGGSQAPELTEPEQPSTKPKPVPPKRFSNADRAVRKYAQENGLNPEHLLEAAKEEVLPPLMERWELERDARKRAYDITGLTPMEVRRLRDLGSDYEYREGKTGDKLKKFDVAAARVVDEFADVFGATEDPQRAVWDFLNESPRQKPTLTDADVLEAADDMVRSGQAAVEHDLRPADATSEEFANRPVEEMGMYDPALDDVFVTPQSGVLFPEEAGRIAKQDKAAEFEAKRWKGEPSEKGRQGKMFADKEWLPDQQGLFDVNAPVEEGGQEETSFRVDAPLANKKHPGRLLTRSIIQEMFPGGKISNTDSKTWNVEIGDSYVTVQMVPEIRANRKALEARVGHPLSEKDFATMAKGGPAAAFSLQLPDGTRHPGLGLVRLVESEATDKKLIHEALHMARAVDLIGEAEWNALVKEHHNPNSNLDAEEQVAIGLENTLKIGEQVPILERIKSWVRRLLHKLGMGPLETRDVYTLLRSAGFWGRARTPSVANDMSVEKYSLRDQSYGRPDLANPEVTPAGRNLVDQVDEQRNQEGKPEQKTLEEIDAEADAMLARDYEGTKRTLRNFALAGGALNESETVALQKILRSEREAAFRSADPKAMQEVTELIEAYRESGATWGRMGVVRHDPMESPMERIARTISEALATPSRKLADRRKAARERSRAAKQNGDTEGFNRATAEADAINEKWAKQFAELKAKLKVLGVDIDNLNDSGYSRNKAAEVLSVIGHAKATLPDKLYEYWRNSILSAPTTQMANFTGNMLHSGWHFTAERITEVVANSIARDPMGAQPGEFKHMVQGILPGISRGARNFLTTWQTEAPTLEYELGATGQWRWEDPQTAIGGRLGKTIRWPQRLLLAVDDFSKSVFTEMEAGAYAFRIAKNEGKTGDALTQRVAELTGDYNSQAWKLAYDTSLDLTFQQRGGPTARKIKQNVLAARRDLPGVRYLLPFVTTPVNIFATGLKKSPLGTVNLGMKMYDNWRKGERPSNGLTPEVAQQVIAWAMVLALMNWTDPDDPWITGSAGEYNFESREVGYRTRPTQSVKIGDQWYSYSRLEPFATVLGMTIDWINGFRKGDDIPNTAIESLVGQAKNKTFLNGVADVLKALEADKPADQAAQWVSNFATSWVPNAARSAAREADDTYMNRRVWGKEQDRRAMMLKRMAQKTEISGIQDYPIYDVWGRPANRSESPVGADWLYRVMVPVKTQEADMFVADRLILNYNNQNPDDARFPLTPAPYYRDDNKTVYMSDGQYADFVKLAGESAVAGLTQGPVTLDPENPTSAAVGWINDISTETRSLVRDLLARKWKGEDVEVDPEAVGKQAAASAIASLAWNAASTSTSRDPEKRAESEAKSSEAVQRLTELGVDYDTASQALTAKLSGMGRKGPSIRSWLRSLYAKMENSRKTD